MKLIKKEHKEEHEGTERKEVHDGIDWLEKEIRL